MVDPIKLTTTFECCTAVRMLLSSLSWNGENRICPNSPTTFSCRTQCGSHLAKFLLFFYKIFLSFYQKGFLKNKTFNFSTFYWRLKRNKKWQKSDLYGTMIWVPFFARWLTSEKPRNPFAPNTVTTFPLNEALQIFNVFNINFIYKFLSFGKFFGISKPTQKWKH